MTLDQLKRVAAAEAELARDVGRLEVYNVDLPLHEAKFSHRELSRKPNVLCQSNDEKRGRAQVLHMGNPFGAKLREARKAVGWSQEKLAQEANLESKGYISALEAGKRPIPPGRTLEALASALGVSVRNLLGDDRIGRTVPVVGYVGAGAAAHYYASGDGELDRVEAPEYANENTVAAKIQGPSIGPLFDGWLVFWDEVRSPVTADMLGELCVVGLPDDRVLVKQLKAASAPGLFHLISNNEPPMLDVEVQWAALVKGMQRR